MDKGIEALIAHMKWRIKDAAQDGHNMIGIKSDELAELIASLEQAQHDLNAANVLIKKIKYNSCHVDTSEGAFVPNSLDAWGRPVPQYLPYDFSGNPGASATQYCNGWNDSGGYWLNHVRDLEERLRATMEQPESAPNGMMQLSNELAEMKRKCVELTVWYGAMPESNGKTNWTAILHRKGECLSTGITIDRSEYPDRVRYEADRMSHLIGELTEEPNILAYDANKHSGYTARKEHL